VRLQIDGPAGPVGQQHLGSGGDRSTHAGQGAGVVEGATVLSEALRALLGSSHVLLEVAASVGLAHRGC